MSLLATLKVMLGVDSVDFQNKMRDSASTATVFENTFGQRATMVERHGLRLVNTADNVAGAMQRMSVDASGAITQLVGAAGFEKLAIGVAAVAATYKVWDSVITLLMASTINASKPVGEMAAAIAGDKAAVESLVSQIDLLAKGLGTSAAALGASREATERNATTLLFLRDALEAEAKARKENSEGWKQHLVQVKLANERIAEQSKLHAESVAMLDAAREAQARFNAEHGKFVPASVQVQIALAKGQQQLKEFADETRKSLGVMNAKDLQTQADLLLKQVVAIAQSGGSATQTVDALGTKIGEIVKVAAELGVQLDPRFKDIAEAIAKGPGLAMDDLFGQFKALPKEVSASRDVSRERLEKMGEDLSGSISGGFGKGIQEGIDFGQQQLAAWYRAIEGRPIKVNFDSDSLGKAFDHYMAEYESGRRAKTAGYTW